MNEVKLRAYACDWLKKHYPLRKYYLDPMVFHNVGFTVTNFLHKKFHGKQLTFIPHYNDLMIRPDIIAILKLHKNKSYSLGWIIGECKVGKVGIADFRQAIHYASVSKAYEAYLFYSGTLSKEVEKLIKVGGCVYVGTNRWGKNVNKRLIILEYDGIRFIKKLN